MTNGGSSSQHQHLRLIPFTDLRVWEVNHANPIPNQNLGQFLKCNFDNPGITDECHLSAGDSGGGVFFLENGLRRLAGINYAVDGPFRISEVVPAEFQSALHDCDSFPMTAVL